MLQPGISAEVKFVVTDELTAKTVGSGTLDVLATPVGLEVTCRAELTEVDGRRLVFKVTAEDARGPIGEGTHERAKGVSHKKTVGRRLFSRCFSGSFW